MSGPLSETTAPIGGRYQVSGYINAGGMQYVYLAEDRLFGRSVALKTPKDDGGRSRFNQSAEVSARVNHANVAKTLDLLDDDGGRPVLIEEFVAGLDLETVLAGGLPYLPPSTVARILHQLAKGLAASHQAGVIHRDLKPSNIMIVGAWRFEQVKITDFGIAKMAEVEIGAWAESQGTTQSKTVLGAIPYMSPESIENFRKSAMPSDVWSIAAIAFRLLEGIPPYGTGLKSVAKILEAAPPPSPAHLNPAQFRGLGAQLYEIILQCLIKDAAARPSAASLAKLCEQLCYSLAPYELGVISHIKGSTGFIKADSGNDLMYHRDNFYGRKGQIQEGQRVWFQRALGQPNDRAFPVVQLFSPTLKPR